MVKLRKARAYDWPDVEPLLSGCGLGAAGTTRMVRGWVAEDDGVCVGFAAVESIGDVAVVIAACVDLDVQGRGIGSVLVEQAINDARDGGARWFFVRAGRAGGFFGHLGFAVEKLDLVPAFVHALLNPGGLPGDVLSLHHAT